MKGSYLSFSRLSFNGDSVFRFAMIDYIELDQIIHNEHKISEEYVDYGHTRSCGYDLLL